MIQIQQHTSYLQPVLPIYHDICVKLKKNNNNKRKKYVFCSHISPLLFGTTISSTFFSFSSLFSLSFPYFSPLNCLQSALELGCHQIMEIYGIYRPSHELKWHLTFAILQKIWGVTHLFRFPSANFNINTLSLNSI